MLVNGGPDSFLQLAGQGVVTTEPAVIAGDPLPARPDLWAVTDGQRRSDDDFGLTTQNVSFTYTATETNPPDDQLGGSGGPPRQLLPVSAAGHQTLAVLSGAAQVTASSYGSWLEQSPQYDPVNAFDDDPSTAWAEGSADTPVGQWIQIEFDHALDLPATIGVQLLADSPAREAASQVEVSTAAGSVSTSLAYTGATQALSVRPGPTSWLRITITAASNVASGAPGAGFAGVLIPGVTVTRYLRAGPGPGRGPAASAVYSFQQQAPAPAAEPGPQASHLLARTFSTSSWQRFSVTAAAVATPGAALDRLIARLTPASPSDARPLRVNQPFQLACGQGPSISVDGTNYRTTVSGTVADLIQSLPVQVRLCADGGQLALGNGRHWLLAAPSGAFVLTDLDLRTAPSPAAGASAEHRIRRPALGAGARMAAATTAPFAWGRALRATWRSTRTSTPAGPRP